MSCTSCTGFVTDATLLVSVVFRMKFCPSTEVSSGKGPMSSVPNAVPMSPHLAGESLTESAGRLANPPRSPTVRLCFKG
jgi:hypothetical protein